MRRTTLLLVLLVAGNLFAKNPFFAMDTGFRRPGSTLDEQLDIVKKLGYDGIAWTENTLADGKSIVEKCKLRKLKIFTIYCRANINAKGELTVSKDLTALMDVLKESQTIIWLYLPGAGPKAESLTGKEPVIAKLRELSAEAAKRKLKIALYPHAGFWIANTSQAIQLAKLVDRPNFGVSFNLIHSLWAGEEKEIPQLLKLAGKLLFCVTINGADRTARPGFRTAIKTLDQGSFDVGIVMKTLRELKYDGPVGFQGYGIKGDTESILMPTMQAWKKLE